MSGLPLPHANRGREFQQELAQTHDFYERVGLASVHYVHVPMVYSHSRHAVVWTQRTPCDYMGYLAGGRAILIEAKSLSDQNRKHWKPDRPHQLEAITKAGKAGACAFFLIRRGIEDVRLWIPGDSDGSSGIALDELPGIRRTWGECIWDWLSALDRLGVLHAL